MLLLTGIGIYFYQDEKKQIKVPKPSTQSFEYFQDSALIIIDKNWEVGQLDSALAFNKNHLPVFYSHADILLFITKDGDTISIQKSQINRKNPLMIFRPEDGPILSSAKGMQHIYQFYFLEKENAIFPPPSTNIEEEQGQETSPLPKPREKVILSNIPAILSGYLAIEKTKLSLTKQAKIELGDRASFYPVLSQNHFLHIRFDNDFWDYTDYYYTNGAAIGYSHPALVSSPISRLLISNQSNGIDYYGIQIVQHMYTGEKPKVDSIIPGDRPWSSYSYMGQFLISFDPRNKIKHYSEFNIGLLGPESGGEFLQNLVHTILPNNSPPQGWGNQIAADFIIDYQYRLQKAIWERKNIESYMLASAQVGTLRDNIAWGFGFTYGHFIPFYQDISVYKRKRITPAFAKKIRFHLLMNVNTKFIGYDATLQGGVFNKSSIYTLSSNELERFVIEGQGGFGLSYGRFELFFIQFWKSKEFKSGKDHKYISTKLNIAF